MFAELLSKRLEARIDLSPLQVELLQKHFELLQRWNKVLNLTSIQEPEEIIKRHYCESLFLGRHLPLGPLSIVDVGSGAGFPGIPVAVLRPECTVVLVESHQRKSVFLREATREMANTRVIAKRIEDLEERFDWAIARAVKYADIDQSLSKIAIRVAFLGGEERPSDNRFTWNTPIFVPWGRKRNLWLGSRGST